jgi:hypothetical protein
VEEATEVMGRVGSAGIDMDDVGTALETKGLEGFNASYQQILAALNTKIAQRRPPPRGR